MALLEVVEEGEPLGVLPLSTKYYRMGSPNSRIRDSAPCILSVLALVCVRNQGPHYSTSTFTVIYFNNWFLLLLPPVIVHTHWKKL